MIRILASKFSSLNCSQSYFTFQRVYKISTNASVHYSKLKPEEIAEKKRKEVSSKSTKLYHFVHMKYHSIVTRLKIYPLFSTIFLAPISYFIQYNQLIPEVQMMPVLSIGITGTVILSTYSALLANTIGIVYVGKDNKTLQIAYIDFWGGQKIIASTIDEIQQCTKSPPRFGLYKTITVNNDKEQIKLKLPLKPVNIYDMKLFRNAFGK